MSAQPAISSPTQPDDTTAFLNRYVPSAFEQLTLELRQNIYSYVGYPVARYIWAGCRDNDHRVCDSLAAYLGWPDHGFHVISHTVRHPQRPTAAHSKAKRKSQPCGADEFKVRILRIVVLDDDEHRWRSAKNIQTRVTGHRPPSLPMLQLDCLLEGHSGLIQLGFETALLEVDKFIRNEILTMLFGSIPVTYYFPGKWWRKPDGPEHSLRTAPLDYMTSVSIASTVGTYDMQSDYRMLQDARAIRHIASRCSALKSFTYSPVQNGPVASEHSAMQEVVNALGELTRSCTKLESLRICSRNKFSGSESFTCYDEGRDRNRYWLALRNIYQRDVYECGDDECRHDKCDLLEEHHHILGLSLRDNYVDCTLKVSNFEQSVRVGIVLGWSAEALETIALFQGFLQISQGNPGQGTNAVTIPFSFQGRRDRH